MGIAPKKIEFQPGRWFASAGGLKRLLTLIPRLQDARGFRLVSYSVVVAAVIVPALVWNSLRVPADTPPAPSLPVYGPFVLIGGILVLEAALILWIKMLQFGNERVRRRRERKAAAYMPASGLTSRPRQQASKRKQKARALAVPRVLVVDDDPINRMIQMPRLDGPEAAHEIRLRKLLPPNVPIIGISTDDTPEFRERCLKAGMQACYHKPVRRFVLEKLVDVYIRGQVAKAPDHIASRTLVTEPVPVARLP